MHKLRNLALAAVAFVALVVPATLVILFVGHFRASPPAVGTLPATVAAVTDTPLSLPPTAAATRTPSVQTSTPTPKPTPSPTGETSPTAAPSPTATEALEAREPITLMALGYNGENEVESIYVVDIDASGETITVTTFAPSILVDVDGAQKKLGLVYRDELHAAGGDEQSATNAVARVLAENFGIAPYHYVTVREDSLASMVDAVGGVDVNVPAALGNIPAGQQHFEGETAWQYVAYVSQPGVPGELDRIQRQRQVLKALFNELLSPAMILKIPRLAREFSADGAMRTDLSTKDMLDLMWQLKGVSQEQRHFITIGEGLG